MKQHDYVILEIARERNRQISDEGWSADHNDQHDDGSLAAAAACYANPLFLDIRARGKSVLDATPLGWPNSWHILWYEPTDRRRDLIKAAALIVAEIERLDRADILDGETSATFVEGLK